MNKMSYGEIIHGKNRKRSFLEYHNRKKRSKQTSRAPGCGRVGALPEFASGDTWYVRIAQ